MEKIKCQNCGREHIKKTVNCCWVTCECGEEICLNCGSYHLSDMMIEENDETNYWCHQYCKDCGQEGCAMCI